MPHLKSETDRTIEALRPMFLAKRRDDIPRIQQALLDRDFDTIKKIGHNVKGVGHGYGFPEIGLAGAALENAARARDLAALTQAARQFSAAVSAAATEAIPLEPEMSPREPSPAPC